MPEQQQNRPQEQVEKKDALPKSPEDQARQQKANEVKDKYGDDSFLEKKKGQVEITAEQARDVLSDTAKLQKFLQEFEQSRMEGKGDMQMRMMKPEHIVREMLDAVKTDTAFLKKVIETYATGKDSENGYVCNNAIERIDLVDDSFFKGVFEKSNDYHIRSEAVRKITDQAFLKGVVEEYRKKGDIGADSEGAATVENLTNQAYLSEIALDTNTDNFIRQAAIQKLDDKKILQSFIDNPDTSYPNNYFRSYAEERLKALEQ